MNRQYWQFLMGNFCTNNLYSQIKQAHPKDFQKYVIGQEMKGILRDKVMSAQAKLMEALHQYKREDLSSISQKERQVQEYYTNIKERADRCYLGGLKGLIQTGYASTDDIFSYPVIQARFQVLRQDVTSKYADEQYEVRNQLAQISKQWEKSISMDQPRVEMYDSLPLKLKGQVYICAVKENEHIIALQSSAFLSPLNKQISVEHYSHRFTNLLPSQTLQAITQQSRQSLDRQLLLLIGNPCQSHAFLS